MKNNLLLCSCVLIVTSLLFSSMKDHQQKKVVIGYVGGFHGFVDTEKISAEKLTHINYAFVDVQGNRAFLTNEKTDTTNFRKLLSLKKKNPELKILISIGGWAWSENFSDAVLSDSSRAGFAASAVDIIRKYHLDGIDIDWEYPGQPGEEGNVVRAADKENFTLMFESLRAALDVLEKEEGQHKMLTTAVGGFEEFLNFTEMPKAAAYLDYINLMTYDLYSGKIAGHHTNLYASKSYSSVHSADQTISAFIAAGVPAEKLVIGIAFYGRNSQVAPGSERGIGAPYLSGSFGKGYTVIKDSLVNKGGYRKFRDEAARAEYLFNSETNSLITYDSEWSVREKCKYVMQHDMGGVMFWEYDSDPKEYLLNEIVKALK